MMLCQPFGYNMSAGDFLTVVAASPASGGVLRCGLQGLRHGQEPHSGSHPVHAEGTTGAARQERPLAQSLENFALLVKGKAEGPKG